MAENLNRPNNINYHINYVTFVNLDLTFTLTHLAPSFGVLTFSKESSQVGLCVKVNVRSMIILQTAKLCVYLFLAC